MQSVGRVCEGVHLLVRALVKKNNVNLCASCAPLQYTVVGGPHLPRHRRQRSPTAQPLSPAVKTFSACGSRRLNDETRTRLPAKLTSAPKDAPRVAPRMKDERMHTDTLSFTKTNAGVDWARVRESYPKQHPLLNLNNAAVSPPPLGCRAGGHRRLSLRQQKSGRQYVDRSGCEAAGHQAAVGCTSRLRRRRNRAQPERKRRPGAWRFSAFRCRPASGVLVSPWDYLSALGGWQQRQTREGIVVDTAAFDPLASDDEIVAAYSSAMRPGTRACFHLTHMLHWTGRVLPVGRLCALARERGIITVVDAAQSFAQMPVELPRRLGCDFFVTSLRKSGSARPSAMAC